MQEVWPELSHIVPIDGEVVRQKLKVCHIYLEGLSPHRGGGVATYLSGLIGHTYKEIDYLLITNYNREDWAIASTMYRAKAEMHAIMPTNRICDTLALARIHEVIQDYDVVHFNDFSGRYGLLIALLRLLSRTRFVFGFRTAANEPADPLTRAAYRQLFIGASRYWDAIVCPSKYQARILEAEYGVRSEKVNVIPNGIDIELYRTARPAELEGKPSILFVGHLEYTKGADLAISAFRLFNEKVPSSYLHIVGGGRRETQYRELANELHVDRKTKFYGRVRREELSEIYKGADMCVFPSRADAFPNVLLEAMAGGKPIVATRIGGIPEIIEDGRNGLLVEVTPRGVATGLLELANNVQLRRKMAMNNTKDVARYSWDQIAKRYVDLYERVRKSGR